MEKAYGLRAPFVHYGGKDYLSRRIVSLIEGAGCRVYVEPCVGAGWVFWRKRPHPVEVLNDIDGYVVNVFRCLQDKRTWVRLARKLFYTPYSLSEFERAFQLLDSDDLVDRAWAVIVIFNQSFSGGGRGWSKSFSDRNVRKWNLRKLFIKRWYDRLKGVQLDCRDVLEVVRYWDTSDTIFYIDPPYPLSSRKNRKAYRYEMSDEHHMELVDLLLNLKGKAVVSSYSNSIYDRLNVEGGWNRMEVDVDCRCIVRLRDRFRGEGSMSELGRRREVLWWNYEAGLNGWSGGFLSMFCADQDIRSTK